MENETKNFKEAIRALLRLKNTACATSQYKYDLLNKKDKLFYTENRIKKIETAKEEYYNMVKKWDDYYDTIPRSIFDLIKYLRFNIDESRNEAVIEKDIQNFKKKINSEIKKQIVNMTFEFIDEENLML